MMNELSHVSLNVSSHFVVLLCVFDQASGEVNVIYKKEDGGVGHIMPEK